jgi:hypothetical protein
MCKRQEGGGRDSDIATTNRKNVSLKSWITMFVEKPALDRRLGRLQASCCHMVSLPQVCTPVTSFNMIHAAVHANWEVQTAARPCTGHP